MRTDKVECIRKITKNHSLLLYCIIINNFISSNLSLSRPDSKYLLEYNKLNMLHAHIDIFYCVYMTYM